ncbi:MAG: hypothetical protein LDL44_12280 [Caenispirillum sp.]|nr:hypothetical protein [Caenispirillum sp.]
MSKTILFALRDVSNGRPERVSPLLLSALELEGWVVTKQGRPRLTEQGMSEALLLAAREDRLPLVAA